MQEEFLVQVTQLNQILGRIANVLEAKPMAAPDIVADLSSYVDYDWSRINAEVIAKDKDGAIAVRHSGKIYTRRNPANKFGCAIWYSRASGKDGDETVYERLITFKEVKVEADPLNEKTRNLLRQSAPVPQAVAPTQPAPAPSRSNAEIPPKGNSVATFTKRPPGWQPAEPRRAPRSQPDSVDGLSIN